MDNYEATMAILRMAQGQPQTAVKNGNLYSGNYASGSLANTARMQVVIETGAKELSLIAEFSLSGDGSIELYEDSIASGGTAVVMYNHLRSSTKALDAVVTREPPILTSSGTQLQYKQIEAGRNNFIGSVREPWVLKPNTVYILRVTNNSGATQRAGVDVSIQEI